MVPLHPGLSVIVSATDSAARREGVEFAAAPLGLPVEDLGEGYYAASRHFGPLAYYVAGVPRKAEL